MEYAAEALKVLPPRMVQAAKDLFNGQDPAHDWQHNVRVIAMCERIGREEGADMVVLRLSALLHDIGRAEERRTGECHAQISARLAEDLMRAEQMGDELIARVQRAILSHRFRKECPPVSLEEKILFDADKLDSIGAIGVARAFAYSGVIGQPIQAEEEGQHTPSKEFEWKLRRIKDRLFTDTARHIAEERHQFMTQFFEQWELEVNGIR